MFGKKAEYRNKGRDSWNAKDWAAHEARILHHEWRIQNELAKLGKLADVEPDLLEDDENS